MFILSRHISLLSLLLCACGSSDRGSLSESIPAPQTVIELTPELELGNNEASPALLVDRIGDVAVDSDGTIYIADLGAATIVVADAAGEFVRRIGSRGEGPGEFRYLSSVSVSGDSVLAWVPFDGPSVFERTTGTYLRRHQLPDIGSYAIGSVLARDADDFLTNANDGRVPGGPNKLLRFNVEGDSAETILTLPAAELLHGSDGSITFPAYLRRSLCAATDGKIYCGFNDTMVFTVVSTGGDSLGVLSVDHDPVEISAAARAGWIDEFAGTAFAESVNIPRHWPAFTSMVGDDRGRLWIALHQEGNDETTIWIVDPATRESSKAVVAGGLRLYACRDGKLYGVNTTRDGDRAVVRYGVGE